MRLFIASKTQDAITAYKSVISTNPSNVDAYVNLAICYASLDDYGNAKDILNNAKNKFPSNKLVLKTLEDVRNDSIAQAMSKASASYDSKDYANALNLYLSVNPATEASLLGAAAAYQNLGKNDKAIEYYKKAFDINPKNAQIPYYIGYLYSEQQNWKEADKYLKQSVAMNPDSEAKNLLSYVAQNSSISELSDGIRLFENKDMEGALTKFNELLKKEPENANAYYYRALIYEDQKRVQLAIADYLNVLKYSKELPIVNYMLAVDYDGLENYKEAYKYYNQFISSYSTEDEYLKYAKDRALELKPYVGG